MEIDKFRSRRFTSHLPPSTVNRKATASAAPRISTSNTLYFKTTPRAGKKCIYLGESAQRNKAIFFTRNNTKNVFTAKNSLPSLLCTYNSDILQEEPVQDPARPLSKGVCAAPPEVACGRLSTTCLNLRETRPFLRTPKMI